jgi:hypothetical protein
MRICLRSEEKTPTLISAKTFLRRLIMNHLQKHFSASLIALAALFSTASMGAWAAAAVAPSLGAASTFAALGGTGVTCTAPLPLMSTAFTVSGGDVGSGYAASSASVTGFPTLCSLAPPGMVLYSDTVPSTTVAMSDSLAAWTTIVTANPCPPPSDTVHNLIGEISKGGTAVLSPGVYCFSGVATLTGKLTLDGGGDPTAVWIFIGTSITPINGSVVMTNSGNACNVYWRLGTTAIFDSSTHFVGNVLAGSGISFTGTTGSSLNGRALAQTLVSMTGANISACGTTQPPPPACDGDNDGKDKDGDCKDKDGDGHDKDNGHDKDKDHKDDSHHSFKEGGSPFDMDEHGDKK